MARKVLVTLVDDLDGTELGENGETVEFAIDGQGYELDLSPENAQKVRDAFGQYGQHARKVAQRRASASGGGRRSGATGGGRSEQDREHTKAIREWAVKHGHMKAESRGRIPTVIREAYEAAQRGEQYALPGTETTPAPAKPEVKAEAKTETTPAKPAGKSTPAPAKADSSKDKDKVPATA